MAIGTSGTLTKGWIHQVRLLFIIVSTVCVGVYVCLVVGACVCVCAPMYEFVICYTVDRCIMLYSIRLFDDNDHSMYV